MVILVDIAMLWRLYNFREKIKKKKIAENLHVIKQTMISFLVCILDF